jgi:simple sugar transport system permease protein
VIEVLLTGTFMTAFIAGTITVAIPLLLAGLGEQISERAGVLNLGLEGMMLVGAFVGFAVTLATGSFAVGFLAGSAGGIATAAIMGILSVMLRLNQIVVGIAITLGMQGATSLAHHVLFARDFPRLPRQPELALPLLSDIPILGPSLFRQNALVYLALGLVLAVGWVLRNTNVGLNLAAAGEKPAALDIAGVSVTATRMWAVLSTGAFAGLGGAYMAEVGAGLFVPFMTGGTGFMAIVLAMLARGRSAWVLIGALVVGISTSVTTALQLAGFLIPTDVVQMIPFATIILVLALFGRRAGLPAALGLSYHRGVR